MLYEDALSYLANILVHNSTLSLLHIEVDLLTKLKKLEDAIEIGKFVSSLNPEVADNWISLANVYLSRKQFESCLKALNNIYCLSEYNASEINQIRQLEGIHFKEMPIPKNKSNSFQIKFSDIIVHQKDILDMSYGASQFYMCDNGDILFDTIKKIVTCAYYRFDKAQKKTYILILEMIKEINFEAFVDLKRKLFFLTVSNGVNVESEHSSLNSQGLTNINNNDTKISINPYLELVIDNLIEDLKIFSVIISEEEGYLTSLFSKEDLSISEVKFCIAIGVLSERLQYYNTALKFYTKALKYCFSKFVFARKINLLTKIKDYKNVMITLAQFLNFIPANNYKTINKTPSWIDKILLKILYEYQINEIISWISDAPKHILDFILKKIIQKYKYWIDVGQELHLIK
jgi:tetratricopeptide (TPR) repeat protein